MTKVEKLSILGVRSFGDDEDDQQVIAFQTPLTLILGQNGCGKTTIIESLKFALSGELPHGGGKTFVHDPKVANNREVMGQIRLLFTDTKGKSVTVTRSMKCTQGATNLSYSTVDQVVTRTDELGSAVSLDSRCADIDAEVSQSLGVSKAVMVNVLFCPQGESNWPLDEGKKVKEKFDAIFDATQYNKCLEHIRKLIKEKTSDLKVLEVEVLHLGNNKKEAEEKRSTLTSRQQRLGNSRDEIKLYQNQLGPITERLNHIVSIENKVHKQHTNLETKKIQMEGIQKQLRELRSNVKTTYPGSTEELRQAIFSFKSELKDKDRFLNNLQEKSKEVEREERKARDDVGIEQVKFGQLKEEEKQFKRLSSERVMKLKSLARELSVSFGSSLDEPSQYEVKHLMNDVERELENLEEELEKCQSQCRAEETRLQSQVNDARDKKVKIDQEIRMKEKQLSDNSTEVSKLKTDLTEVQSSAGRLTKLEEDLRRAEDDLKDEELTFDMESEKFAIVELKEKRDRLQSILEEVHREIQGLQHQTGLQAELDVYTQSKSNKEAEIKRLQRKHSDTLLHLLQRVPERGFKHAVEGCLEKLSSSIADMNYQIREKDKEVTSLDTNRKHLKEQLRKKEDLLRENEEKLYELCGGEEYEEKLMSLRRQVEELQDIKGTLTSSEYLFRRYIKKLGDPKPCCPLCHRDFKSDTEAESLVSDLNRNVHELPSKLRENKAKLDSFEEKYNKLLELKPVQRSISEMKENEIPDLRRKVAAIESQLRDVKVEIENLQADLRVPQTDEEVAKSTMSDMILLDQMIAELQQINRDIDRISASLPPGESNRTMKSAQTDQQNIQLELKDSMKESEMKQTAINSHSEKISKLREKRNHIMSEKLKIQSGLQASNSLRDKLKEKEELKEILEKEISLKMSELYEADSSMKKIQSEKEKATSSLHKKVEESREKVDQVKRHFREIESFNKMIKKMETDGVEQNVDISRERLERLKKNAEAAFSKRQDILQKMDEIRKDLSTQQVKERELGDNLQLRELQSQEETLDTEISKLKIELGDVKFETMRGEKRKLCIEEEQITKKISVAEGRKMELEKNIFELEKDLNKGIYKNADKDFCEKYFALMVSKKAIEDLKQFNVALDWAIMHFHKERMQSINAIIRELWIAVYKGNDVDYIEIRTDEGGEGTTITENRRSYKYRVVMLKNGVEVDMRDRCSAGQRMLACLIIRLALAETFSAKCGVFALDEPTANLDVNNSLSLSEALAEIVKRRYSQKNFQLIVITHDEKFVECLAKERNLNRYYEVSRNSQGKSVIRAIRTN